MVGDGYAQSRGHQERGYQRNSAGCQRQAQADATDALHVRMHCGTCNAQQLCATLLAGECILVILWAMYMRSVAACCAHRVRHMCVRNRSFVPVAFN